MLHNIKKDLLKIIKDKNRIYTREDYTYLYSFDATRFEKKPSFVVFPLTEKEISRITRYAYKQEIPLYIRGAGTGKSGGSVPVQGGIVLCLTLMKNILAFDEREKLIIVEPGIITKNLKNKVKEFSLFYPPDPQSMDICTIGGNVATNAGGPRALKYGSTGNYVRFLEAILCTGEIIKLGKETKKFVMGYNLKDLLIGGEGSLGVITKIGLNLIPLPENEKNFVICFEEKIDTLLFIQEIFSEPFLPSMLELIDKEIIISFENEIETQKFKKFLKGNSQKKTLLESEKDIKLFQKKRKEMTTKLWQIKGGKLSLDITLPLSSIIPFFEWTEKIKEKENFEIFFYGHIGSGNLHTNLLFKPEKEEMEKVWEIRKEIILKVLELKGTSSGEHGTGFIYSQFLDKEIGRKQFEIQREIKRIFDKRNIFNPGKIFDRGNTIQKIKKQFLRELSPLTQKCTLCGLCIPVCPLYRETPLESRSPRGFVFLFEKFLNKKIKSLKIPSEYIDFCKSCKKCFSTCPNDVNIKEIFKRIEKIEKNGGNFDGDS